MVGIFAIVASPHNGDAYTGFLTRVSHYGQAGDSGGPVFSGNKAMGIITAGSASVKVHFTPSVWVEAALDVEIKTL